MHTRGVATEQQLARPRGVHPLAKYLVLQIPGLIFVGLVLGYLVRAADLSLHTAALLLALWVAKDLALFPFVRIGYERGNPSATEGLIGALGTTQQRLDPEGYVRVGAELWRARVRSELAPIELGAAIRVLEVSDLTLHVEPA